MKTLASNLPRKTRFLVVEDEAIIAMYVEDLLLNLGYEVQKAGRIEKAKALLLSNSIDAVLLDVNIDGATVFPFVPELRARDVPFAFMTGYEADWLPPEFRDCPILKKPIAEKEFTAIVVTLAARSRVREGSEHRSPILVHDR